MKDVRAEQLLSWLENKTGCKAESFTVVSGDASFRRYFRFIGAGQSIIAVDAPPDKESCKPFVAIATGLMDAGLKVPQVHFVDFDKGFMGLSDLGDKLLLSVLEEIQIKIDDRSIKDKKQQKQDAKDKIDYWYQLALKALPELQQVTEYPEYSLPEYTQKLLMQEMTLLPDWFLARHLQLNLKTQQVSRLAQNFERLTQLAQSQPQVTVHRDYHSRNLMVLNSNQLGILDFQDAVYGPVTYDLISLVKDSYIHWPQQQVDIWIKDFHQRLSEFRDDLPSTDEFIFWADSMAIQRHIKVAGIFSRLYYRDRKSGYLKDIPQTLDYIVEAGKRHSEFSWLAGWVESDLLARLIEAGVKQ